MSNEGGGPVHILGPMVSGKQSCSRCGFLLFDFSRCKPPWNDPAGSPTGSLWRVRWPLPMPPGSVSVSLDELCGGRA